MKIPIARLLPACLILTMPALAIASEVSIDSTTVFRYERPEVSGGSKQTLAPATEFLGLDVDKLADGNLSLHLSGWGRYDLADKSFNNDRTAGSLTYGYLQYRLNLANADLRAGRFFVHEGVVNEQLDGVSVRTDLPAGFGLSAFGGAAVHTKKIAVINSDGKGDSLFGGRVNYRHKGMLELGLSGVYEGKAPETANALAGSIKLGNHRLVGGDIWLSPVKFVELTGHSSYNPETKKVAEHTYLLNIKPLPHLTLSSEFNEHREGSFLNSSALFTRIPDSNDSTKSAFNPNETSRSIGGIAAYAITKSVDVAADYKHYTRANGNADRYGADIRLAFLKNSLRSGFGYHYLRAGQGFAIGSNPDASYHELRCYALYDAKKYFAAVDFTDQIFKSKVNSEKSAWEASASLGYRITQDLAASGDISHGRNPQYTSETKGLIRLTYNVSFKSKGDK